MAAAAPPGNDDMDLAICVEKTALDTPALRALLRDSMTEPLRSVGMPITPEDVLRVVEVVRPPPLSDAAQHVVDMFKATWERELNNVLRFHGHGASPVHAPVGAERSCPPVVVRAMRDVLERAYTDCRERGLTGSGSREPLFTTTSA